MRPLEAIDRTALRVDGIGASIGGPEQGALESAAELIWALREVYEAAAEEHGERDHEPECSLCQAVRRVNERVSREDAQ